MFSPTEGGRGRPIGAVRASGMGSSESLASGARNAFAFGLLGAVYRRGFGGLIGLLVLVVLVALVALGALRVLVGVEMLGVLRALRGGVGGASDA